MNAQTRDLPTTISASRIAAMLGMDKWCSPLTLFHRMRGNMPEKRDDEAMMQGRFYERATADVACHKYGMKIVEGFEQTEMVDGALSGHPDFLVLDENNKLAICEVKNPFNADFGDEWGDPGSDIVPRGYFIQSLAYLHLFLKWAEKVKTGQATDSLVYQGEIADYIYVVVRLRGGVERYKVHYDAEIIGRIEADAAVFLSRVRNNDPPTPEDEEDMRNRWPVTEGKKAECNSAFLAQLETYESINKQMKELAKQQSALKTLILAFAEDADGIEYVDENGGRTPVVTLGVDRSFDAAQCLADHPELIEKGYYKLDASRIAKEQKALHEMYMKKPQNVDHGVGQKRVIRLKRKNIENLLKGAKS